ncbi:MAG: pyridoxal phosphate-dependent aminotransferase [Bacteroidetes bacterium]|nr:pyridoxal phosphate-dependent aminotransferase [Bacteroidota bacterium]
MSEYSNLISSIQESKTLAITALIKKLRTEGKPILSFSAGEPDFNTPEYIKSAAISAINNNQTRYTPVQGTAELIESIITKFKKDNNLLFTNENILVSTGAKHSIFNIIMALCNPGDEVIFQSPYWVSYPDITKIAQAIPVIINTDIKDNFKINPNQLKQSITEKTKVFLFNTPSNPTGTVYSKQEILDLAEVLIDKDIFIVSDEIYEKILFDGEEHFSIGSIEELKDRTITINGVSKAFAMTGWRIGYAGGNKDIIKLAKNLQSQSTSNASSISQAAANAALNGDGNEISEMVDEFNLRRNYIVKELQSIDGINCQTPKGAFYTFFDVSNYYNKSFNNFTVIDSISFCNYLIKEANIGLVPGVAFGNDNCVRMSYAASMDNIKEGISRLKVSLSKLN